MKKKCIYCEREVRACELCSRCYKKKKWREKRGLDSNLLNKIKRSKFNEICSECSSKSFSKGLCKKCYMFKWHGSKNQLKFREKPKEKNGNGCLRKDGYRILMVDGKRILEHKHIMSKKLGRELMKNETVHHINGIRCDNRIENLELWSTSHPSGQRVEDKIAWCKEFLESYSYKV